MGSGADKYIQKNAGGKACPKCGKPMQRWVHSIDWTPRRGHGFYNWWDKCEPCKHLQHYTEAHVDPS